MLFKKWQIHHEEMLFWQEKKIVTFVSDVMRWSRDHSIRGYLSLSVVGCKAVLVSSQAKGDIACLAQP